MGHATAKSGCAAFSISQDVTDPETLTICEQWATREDLDEHVRSADYRLLLAVIDLSVTPPDISFDDLGHIGGLELVQALRGRGTYSPKRTKGTRMRTRQLATIAVAAAILITQSLAGAQSPSAGHRG